MKLESTSKYSDIGLFLVRLAFGFRLMYGTQDNILSWDRMLEFEEFLAANGFPIPLVSAVVSVYLQFIAGLAWIVGFKVRLFALLMILNFSIALLMVHVGDTYLSAAPAIHLLIVSVLLLTIGGGKYGFDRK